MIQGPTGGYLLSATFVWLAVLNITFAIIYILKRWHVIDHGKADNSLIINTVARCT